MAQSKAKSNSVVTTQWSGNILTIGVIGAGTIRFDRTKASVANRDQAERHGWTQRHCDKAAKGRDPNTGKSASPQSKFEAILASVEHYESGNVDWRMGAASHEGGLLFEALCEFRSDKSAQQIRDFLDTRDAKQLAKLRASKELMPIINRLRAERAGDVDTSEALSDLDAMDEEEELTGDELDAEIAEELKQ